DGKHLLTASSDGTLRIWALENGEEVSRFEDQERVEEMCVSHNGMYVALATNAATRICACTVEGLHPSDLNAYPKQPYSKEVTASGDAWRVDSSTVATLFVRRGDDEARTLEIPGKVLSAQFSPNRRYLAALCDASAYPTGRNALELFF